MDKEMREATQVFVDGILEGKYSVDGFVGYIDSLPKQSDFPKTSKVRMLYLKEEMERRGLEDKFYEGQLASAVFKDIPRLQSLVSDYANDSGIDDYLEVTPTRWDIPYKQRIEMGLHPPYSGLGLMSIGVVL